MCIRDSSTFDIVGPYAYLAKKHFDRVRPSFLDEQITPCIPVPGHPAYPSGHATEAFSVALVLGHVEPVHAQAYLRVASTIAHNREIAGVHYRSDTLAGQRLATALFPTVVKQLGLTRTT